MCLSGAYIALASCNFAHGQAEAGNKEVIRPGQVWNDTAGVAINAHGGGILYHEGVYYWFGEHKIEGEAGNHAMVGVRCYSSRDLYQWKNEGVALAVSEADGSEIQKGCILERPKVIFNRATGKFVMWFHLERKGKGYSDARSGVAVADSVAGPYRYVESFRPNAGIWPENFGQAERVPLTEEEKKKLADPKAGYFPASLILRRDFEGGQMARDMTLFVDDDQTAYHIFASEENRTLHISKLSPDYLRPAGEYVRIFPDKFNEAPSIVKHEGKYFIVSSDCSGWNPNPARSSVADRVMGPWQALGNPCRGDEAQNKTTFQSQSTYLLPVAGKPGQIIYMGDRWNPGNAIDGRYVWLPLEFEEGKPVLKWREEWSLPDLGKKN